MRRPWAITVLACLTLLGAAGTTSPSPQRQLGPDQRLDRMLHRLGATSSDQPAATTLDNFRLIGHRDRPGLLVAALLAAGYRSMR